MWGVNACRSMKTGQCSRGYNANSKPSRTFQRLYHMVQTHTHHISSLFRRKQVHIAKKGAQHGMERAANEGNIWHKHPRGWRELCLFGKATFPALDHHCHSREVATTAQLRFAPPHSNRSAKQWNRMWGKAWRHMLWR